MVRTVERRKALLGSVAMTIGLVAWMVTLGSSAYAGAAGVGVGSATFTVSSPTPPCSAFNAIVLTVGQTGSYSASNPGTGTSTSYTGASTMQATVSATFYEGPLGTHGNDSTCSPLTAGTVIPATVEVTS
ncbi:MAG: hypothetical protein ACR2FO_03545, partial [Actinomycetota bacterium]